jgi:histidine kinase-like protein
MERRAGDARHDRGAPIAESARLPATLDQALEALAADSNGTATFPLPPDPESVTAARHFTVRKLRDWNMAALTDDVALVVSELVTNALRHSVPALPDLAAVPGANASGLPDPAMAGSGSIRLRLVHEHPWLLCGIFDCGTEAPRRREPDFVAETGRGLHLVESFTHRWGWRGLADGGKVVWALFRLR